MKRIVAIDIPWMALLGVGSDNHLLETLDAIQQNGCFVQFRGDHNFEYHGMDLKDNAVQGVVPEYIRKKYHK